MGRFWLGRRVSRGLGWLGPVVCKVYELPAVASVVDQWPCSKLDSTKAFARLEALAKRFQCIRVHNDLKSYLKDSKFKVEPQRAYLRWQGTIRVGAYQPEKDGDTYGLDALSIGAHGSFVADAESFGETHLINATDQGWDQYKQNFAPDMSLAMVRRGNTWEPYIPGSAIAGSLRHWLSHSERREKKRVWDPVAQETYESSEKEFDISKDPLALLMGYVLKGPEAAAQNSHLLVAECYLADDCRVDWKVALGEKVALDEFTQGPFEGSKFNRLAVLEATFAFQMVLEIDITPDADVRELCEQNSKLVEHALGAARVRRIGLGGGEFRSYGHVGLNVEKTEFAIAGGAWETWPAGNITTQGIV